MPDKSTMRRIKRRSAQWLNLTSLRQRTRYFLCNDSVPRNPRLYKLYDELVAILGTNAYDATQLNALAKDILSRAMLVLREHPLDCPDLLYDLMLMYYNRPMGREYLYWGRVSAREDDQVISYRRYLYTVDKAAKICRHELWRLAIFTLDAWDIMRSYAATYDFLRLAIVADDTIRPITIYDALSFIWLMDVEIGKSEIPPAVSIVPTDADVTIDDQIADIEQDIGAYMCDDAIYYLTGSYDNPPTWRQLCAMYERADYLTQNMTDQERLDWWLALKHDMLIIFRPICQDYLKAR